MKTNNLKKRIENINRYIGLASKLDEIINDSHVKDFISVSIDLLGDLRKEYSSELEQRRQDIKLMIEENQTIGKLAHEFYNEDFQKAKESLEDLILNLRKYFFSDLRKACNYAFLCVLTAPFSRKISRAHYNIFGCYRNAARSLKKAIASRKEAKKIEQKTNEIKIKNIAKRFNILHDIEFTEAKLSDILVDEWGFDKKIANYIVREQQEIYVFVCLESLKEKYGNGKI